MELAPTEQDIERIDQLTKRYASLPLGLADAAVVANAGTISVAP